MRTLVGKPALLWLCQVLLGLTCLPGAVAEDILKQVIVITRHGSRYPLQKRGVDLSEPSTGRLTAFGQKQLYDLGKYLHETYSRNGFLDQFYPDKVRLESSSYERTITSANSLALGLFDATSRDPTSESLLPVTPANVPVFMHDRENDIWMRAYDKCPTLHQRLEQLYQSPEWSKTESDNSQFLAKLAETTQFHPYSSDVGIVPLSDVWNVYDAISVAKTECTGQDPTPTCQSLPNPEVADILTEAEWDQLQSLSHNAELQKYGIETSGKLVGVNLLLEIVERMQSNDYQFSVFSAHYPTILGLFSALDMTFFLEEIIPNYGAALIFEVTQVFETGQRRFKLVYKGDDESTAVAISLEHLCGDSRTCPVESLATHLKEWDTARWCTECDNQSANICLKLKLSSMQQLEGDSNNNVASNNNHNSNDNETRIQHPLVLVAFAVVLIGMFLTAAVVYHNKEKEQQVVPIDTIVSPPPPRDEQSISSSRSERVVL